ncbi:MAG: hypothetical protein MJZ50_05810 [Treponema sp.]|nr:hypothetical protein [Treponema sp.]
MKKTLIAFAAAAALTTSAFAEITFGAWLRALAAPVASDGKDTVASMGNSWGWGARTARLDVHARSEDGNIGFEMGAFNDVGGLSMGDDAYMWGKPVDALTVSFGKFDGPRNGLRGDICYGSWDWLRPTSSWLAEDEGLLMSGLNNTTGVKLDVTPIDGLLITAFLPITTTQAKAEDVYKNIQAGFGYDIEGVGKIKAQFIGKATGKVEAKAATTTTYYLDEEDGTVKSKDNAVAAKDARFNKTLEAEFDLTAVENLWLGLGAQFNLYEKKEEAPSAVATKIALGAKFQATDTIGLSASAAYFMYNKKKDDGGKDPRFQAGVGVGVAVADGVNVSADVRYLSKEKDVDNSDHLAFSAGVTKSISSNGYIGVAAQAQTNGGDWANNVIKHNEEKGDKLTWCVPVALSCWF